jgi:serralysin
MADYRGTASADSIDQAALGIPDWSALYGLVGNDTLTIGRGVGLGGAGDDTIIAGEPTASGAGYFDAPAGVVADLQRGVVQDGWGGTDTLVGIRHLDGSTFDDFLFGSSQDNRIVPNGGHDRIDGRGGFDIVWLAGKLADYRIDTSIDGVSATLQLRADPTQLTEIVGVERVDFQSLESVLVTDLIDPVKQATHGLIATDTARWNAGQALGTPIEVTFSFMTGAPDAAATGFLAFDTTQQGAVRSILNDTAALTGLRFREVDESAGTIGQMRFGSTAQSATKGQATLPVQGSEAAGDVLMDVDSVRDLAPGSEGFAALRHEIGHALGLRHPRNYGAADAWSEQFRPEDDNAGNTVMTDSASQAGLYRLSWGPLDLIALRTMYGSKLASAGDSVHVLTDGAGTGLGLLLDEDGFDELDLSGVSAGSKVDLRASHMSSVGRGADGLAARDNLALPAGTAIERVTGTPFDDALIGNEADNWLQGGLGNDRIDGGPGADLSVYAGARDQYAVSVRPGQISVQARDGAGGFDTLVSIERLRFTDAELPLAYQRTALAPGPGKDASFLFDPIYYLLSNTALVPVASTAAALASYREVGAAQGRAPTAWFDSDYYSNRWADLAPLQLDDATLFAHFNLFGVWEGRSPGPRFDDFDGARYLRDYPDVAAYVNGNLGDFLGSQTNGAIAHYLLFGANEQRLAFDSHGAAVDVGYLV